MIYISYTLTTANTPEIAPFGGINFEDGICYISFLGGYYDVWKEMSERDYMILISSIRSCSKSICDVGEGWTEDPDEQ